MIIADTGIFVALFNRRDQNYDAVQTSLRNLSEPLITTYPVLTETCNFLLKRSSSETAIQFPKQIQRGVTQIFDLQPTHIDRLIILMEQYSDRPMDFADASLVVLAEALGHGRILTVDRSDF
jgi:uncharacterized protein